MMEHTKGNLPSEPEKKIGTESATAEKERPEEPTFDFIMEVIGVPAGDTEKIVEYQKGLEDELQSHGATLERDVQVWGWDKENGWMNDWKVSGNTPDGQVMIERFLKDSESGSWETATVAEDDLRRRNYLFNLVNAKVLVQEGEPLTNLNEMIDHAVMGAVAEKASDLIEKGKQSGGLG